MCARGDKPFDRKGKGIAATLRNRHAEAAMLDVALTVSLRELGHGG